ncbi:30S ribosomal protein S6 [Desulfurispirillum indicum]|uniref:Small ribosomal subunit protein bS6 n=1 Tax=Desulfurispirillum indicum (strain ATCC BAA-1389 / DSM 22839 / S5) TaxID=653733 RepID=E6W1E0_DESIS|nr:30S ribosomal protein S6 [Desulfurispirillum indicum]ADU65396.1 ribosomal protein S6 [Desulfurispirillum indicum S5]UCZ57290.1 30S ribosomal protein S6 [Desulfurispirillum indicum]
MKKYELMFILKPELDEQQLADYIARVDGIIARYEGTIDKFENWGKKKLAYEIDNKSFGFYYLYHLSCASALIDELERNFKISDEMMRFISLRLDKKALEALSKAEQSKAAAAQAQTAQYAASVSAEEPESEDAEAPAAAQEESEA